MSVILIGMPSCGKSTVGVLLAKKLGYRFVDSDLLIQEEQGRLLHDIIAEDGIEGFIDIEDRLNSGIREKRAVISTGGSVIYGEEAMRNLASLGKIVYLRISYEVMTARLGDYVHRGVVLRNGCTLRDMYDEREPLYRKYADITVDCADSIPETLERIVSGLDCAE